MHGTVRNFTNLGELWEVNSRFTADILLAYLRRCGQFLCFSDQEYDWQGKTVTSRAQYKHCYLAKMLCLSVCPPGCVFVHNFVTLLECQQVSVRAHWAHKNLQNTDNMRWAILWEVYCVSIRLQIHTRKHVRKKKKQHILVSFYAIYFVLNHSFSVRIIINLIRTWQSTVRTIVVVVTKVNVPHIRCDLTQTRMGIY